LLKAGGVWGGGGGGGHGEIWGCKEVLVQHGPFSFGENIVSWGAMPFAACRER
jgi:hypothetical protein